VSSILLSIIVPVYNVACYVERCLRSIDEQTIRNFEVIIVDDGSTDSSLDICSKFVLSRPNFYVFTKENEGQGVARNFGLTKASGEFICYVDSDDWIEPSMAEDVMRVLIEKNADFANFGLDFVSLDNQMIKKINHFDIEELYGLQIFLDALIDKNILSVSWNKIYRRSFLLQHNILFPPFRVNEDLFYSRAVSFFAKKTVFISKVYYHALVRPGSTSRKMSSEMFNVSVDLIRYERNFFHVRLNDESSLLHFNAHVIKFLSYMLIQSAFRIPAYSEYRSCFEIANNVNYHELGLRKDVLSVLTFKGRIMVLLCRMPLLLRVFASALKRLGLSSFVY
jgi:glycosyltransferase EpsH